MDFRTGVETVGGEVPVSGRRRPGRSWTRFLPDLGRVSSVGRKVFPSAGRGVWVCLLLAAAAFAMMAVALSASSVDWVTVYLWMGLGLVWAVLSAAYLLKDRKRRRWFVGVGVGVALACLGTLFWAERPMMIDALGSMTFPDGRHIASASTWRVMRMFGEDEYFHRFRVVKRGSQELVKQWDVPYQIPPRPAYPEMGTMSNAEYQRKVAEWNEATSRPLFDSLLFEKIGSFEWSKDSRRVGGEREISGLRLNNGEMTFSGFLPTNEVVLKGSPRLRNCFLDLDTEKVMSAPGEWVDELRAQGKLYDGNTPPSVLREWMSRSGADLFRGSGSGRN